MNKPKPVFRIEMIRPVQTTRGTLTIGQVIRSELESRGTNWIKVRLPMGNVKTLFNFEAKWTLAN